MQFLGTKEASEKLGVKQSTVTRWCRERKIKGAEQDVSGSPWRIPVSSIQEFLEKRRKN